MTSTQGMLQTYIMLSKTFRNKRITAVALTSILLVSFCLIPCGKAGLLKAEAAMPSTMAQGMAGEMEEHSCHDSTASADFQLKADEQVSCLHCDVSTPAIIQTVSTDFSNQTATNETVSLVSLSTLSTSYVKWATLRPPGPDRPIHLLNATFII